MKKFYFLLDGDIITDAIDYYLLGYTEIELNQTHLPAGINGGCYRLVNGSYQLDQTLKDLETEDVIQKAIDEYTLELLKGGLI